MTRGLLTAAAIVAAKPAGGAAIGQVVIATGFATLATVGLLWLMKTHPSGENRALPRGRSAPVGGVLIAACGAFALIGFPLDDMWHRLFGQDVTLWGPTHLMLFGGASMTLVGQALLLHEGMRARRASGETGSPPPVPAL